MPRFTILIHIRIFPIVRLCHVSLFFVEVLHEANEGFLEFRATLLNFGQLSLVLTHERFKPLWNLINVIQSKYFVEFAEGNLEPPFIDFGVIFVVLEAT